MVENFVRQTEQALKNLANIGEITSWDDFTSWYNRQLYLENMTENAFNSINIKIGGSNYKLLDIEGMAYGVKDSYIDYWDKEFTPEQNREMWLGLGMTPANYAYVQTWKGREQELARRFLTSSAVQNDEYMQSMIRNNRILKRLAGDSLLPDDEKIDEKELSAMGVETALNTNKTVNDIAMSLAEIQDFMITTRLQDKASEMYFEELDYSEGYDADYFRPLRRIDAR